MQHQVNLSRTKKHHNTIRDMMATPSHVFSSISRGGTQWVIAGYMSVGYLFFLQEQIQDIVIITHLLEMLCRAKRSG
jgi:hypothetical protein